MRSSSHLETDGPWQVEAAEKQKVCRDHLRGGWWESPKDKNMKCNVMTSLSTRAENWTWVTWGNKSTQHEDLQRRTKIAGEPRTPVHVKNAFKWFTAQHQTFKGFVSPRLNSIWAIKKQHCAADRTINTCSHRFVYISLLNRKWWYLKLWECSSVGLIVELPKCWKGSTKSWRLSWTRWTLLWNPAEL